MDTVPVQVVARTQVPADDVRVEVRLRNNRLYSAIVAGYPNVNRFCVAAKEQGFRGIQPTPVGQLLNLKMSPFRKKTPEFRSVCVQIERMLRIPAEDLFPARLYRKLGVSRKAFTFNSSMLRFSPREATFIEDNHEESPDEAAIASELRERVGRVLTTLTYREREAVKLFFGFEGYDYTYEEIGRIFKVTEDRVKMVLAKAIRKLQHPVRARKLEEFLPPLVPVALLPQPGTEPVEEVALEAPDLSCDV